MSTDGEKKRDKAKIKRIVKQTFNERGIGRSIIGDGSAGVKGKAGVRVIGLVIGLLRSQAESQRQNVKGMRVCLSRRMIRPA